MLRLQRILAELRASPRRQWLTTFLLVSLLAGLWALANPLFSGPDEPAHVVRAEAVSRGQWTGDKPEGEAAEEGFLEVRVPRIYGDPTITCFAYQRNRPASCQSFEGPSEEGSLLTQAGRHPPAYYAVAGLVSRPYPPGSGSVYLMRLVSVLVTGAFVASAVTALRRSAEPRFAAVGLVIAITPMVLFVSGIVNPSALEIAAAILLWSSGAVLVARAHDRVDPRLVALVGIAASALVVSRQLGPLWLGLIAIAVAALGTKSSLLALLRSRAVRVWMGVVGACTLAQILWLAIQRPLDAALVGHTELDLSSTMILRTSFGATFARYVELIGSFGWLDTPAPKATFVLWTAALGALLLLVMAFSRRRDVLVLLGLVVATVAVPVALEYSRAREAGGFFWQGRYTLPIAVGIPIVAALSLTGSAGASRLVRSRVIPTIGILAAGAHVLAFAQNLRRNTVGYDGPVLFWRHEHWHPPLPSWLLTAAFTVAIVAFLAWLLAPEANEAQPSARAG